MRLNFIHMILYCSKLVAAQSSSASAASSKRSCTPIQHQNLKSQPDRAEAIIEAYRHAWTGYRKYAFPRDELKPLSKTGIDNRYGWGVTVVDGLDTAILMGLRDIVMDQLDFIANIDFTASRPSGVPSGKHKPINAFKANIRYVGGLLSAHDLLSGSLAGYQYPSDAPAMLLDKARTLANKLAHAFDTPFGAAAQRLDFMNDQPIAERFFDASTNRVYNSTCTACAGTYLLEFYRLSDLTGNETFRDLADRSEERLLYPYPPPKHRGLVGTRIDLDTGNMLDLAGGWQSSIDSYLEYLIKSFQYAETWLTEFYKDKWLRAVESTRKFLLKHPLGFQNVTFLDQLDYDGLSADSQDNYACFAGGNLLLGCKLLDMPELCDMGLAVTDGCHWIYNHTETGLGPVIWYWLDDQTGQQPSRPLAIADPARIESAAARGFYIEPRSVELPHDSMTVYMSFPETLESIFYAYRITGDTVYQDWAWEIFEAINTTCRNDVAFAGITNVDLHHGGTQSDRLDSFFFAETLKYLYLTLADPDLANLDYWVFNTEAHPLRARCD